MPTHSALQFPVVPALLPCCPVSLRWSSFLQDTTVVTHLRTEPSTLVLQAQFSNHYGTTLAPYS
uniref:Uncharacterized protein n=1 Tax=Anguilla anguilla TaxID=7936 RepID=A0A0E9PU82_ANGAN